MPAAFNRAKEDSTEMHAHYARVDAAHEELRATWLGDGIPVEITPPANVKYVPEELRGKKDTYYLHFYNCLLYTSPSPRDS